MKRKIPLNRIFFSLYRHRETQRRRDENEESRERKNPIFLDCLTVIYRDEYESLPCDWIVKCMTKEQKEIFKNWHVFSFLLLLLRFQGINGEWRLFVYSPVVILRRRDWKSFCRRDKSLTWTLLRINNVRKWFNCWLAWLYRCCLDFLVVFLCKVCIPL